MSNLKRLNEATEHEALTLIEPLIERAPDIAKRVTQRRPFPTIDDLEAAITAELMSLSEGAKIDLFNAHPELGSNKPLEMTLESQNEQGRLNLTSEVSDATARLKELNGLYRKKFGFPFITAVARHSSISSILNEFEKRLSGERRGEIDNAIGQVIHICGTRAIQQFGDH